MRKLKQNNLSLWIAIIGVAVLAIGSVSFAAMDKVINIYGNYIEAQESQELGGVTWDDEIFKQDITTNGNLEVDGTVLGGASFEFDLDFTVATGTGSVALPDTQGLIGSVQNDFGEDLICTMAFADITATGLYNFDLTGGVATTATSSATVIASNTVTTSTDEIVQQATIGTAFDFASGSYFTVTRTTQAVNATSSASFTTAGGMVGDGKAYLYCTKK